jgi:hypothetical protein
MKQPGLGAQQLVQVRRGVAPAGARATPFLKPYLECFEQKTESNHAGFEPRLI